VTARVLALASAIGAAVLVLVALVAYRELLYYERRASQHVPAGAELVLRVDLEQVVLFEPVRRHLLPLVDRASIGAGAPSSSASRLMRLRQAGLNLGFDLREVVFAQLEHGGGWLLVLGGIFGDEPLLSRIEGALREEPGARLRSERGMIIFEASGAVLGQASDGVLLLASDAAVLERALPPGPGDEALGVSPTGPAAFGASGHWLRALGAPNTVAAAASLSLLRASARLELGDPLRLTAEVEHREPVESVAVRRELEAWLGTPQDGADFAPQADWGGERALAARAVLTQSTPTRVSVQTTWQRDELDRAARSLAAWLEPRLAAAGRTAR
jgi:hypothetical protein